MLCVRGRQVNKYKMRPKIIVIINMLGKPVIAIKPNTASIHKTRMTEAISRKGEGSIPITQAITATVKIFHSVIG